VEDIPEREMAPHYSLWGVVVGNLPTQEACNCSLYLGQRVVDNLTEEVYSLLEVNDDQEEEEDNPCVEAYNFHDVEVEVYSHSP